MPPRGINFLAYIINSCLKLNYFPPRWKHARVVPIPKHGKDLSKPENFRPISLLCSLSKILERVILNRLNSHIELEKIIPDEQHGFRKKFSTTSQLAKLIETTKENLNNKKSTGLVMLDVEKAFDRVWHAGLLHKMIKTNFPPYLICMVSNFLHERSFHVDVNGAKSITYDIPYGVPQGAVLSPTLYNIFTYDIPKSPKTKLAVFADDTAYHSSSEKVSEIVDALQEHAKSIQNYMNKWKININNSKTQAIFFTNRRKKEIPRKHIRIFGSNVTWSTEAKYLGVVLDKRMTHRKHIEYVTSKANIAIRTLYPLLSRNSKLHISNKLLVYKLAIRPIFTYACPAFSNIANCHVKKLQIIQNKALKMILNVSRFERTLKVHEETGVPLVLDYIFKLSTKFHETYDLNM